MRVSYIFCFLIFISCANREKVSSNNKTEVESEMKIDSTSSTITQEETIVATPSRDGKQYYALNNQLYTSQKSPIEDVIFEKAAIINILDTIETYNVGVFRGKWLKGYHEKKEFLIPSFCVISVKEMTIPNFKLLEIIEENKDKISYTSSVTDTFSSHEEIVFNKINEIEVAYFLIKAIYERENNIFPLDIEQEGRINDFLEVSFIKENKSLVALSLKWLFEGGDLVIKFNKNKNGVQVTVDESFG